MALMWSMSYRERWRAARAVRDEQARFVTLSSLRWVIRHRAYSPWYLVRYWRLLRLRITQPHVVLKGMVFLGKDCEIHCHPGLGYLELGRWCHIGDGTALRCHEGSLRVGDRVVYGVRVVVNAYLDIEVGACTLLADNSYVCDFDHRTEDILSPIKDQGIVTSPVRIGPDCWLGTKVTVTRGTFIGKGSVLGAHAVARGIIPDYSIAVGIPARVVKNRKKEWEDAAEYREQHARDLADIERKKAGY